MPANISAASGVVTVSNQPAAQTSINVGNFPATQAVSGALSDTQLRATPLSVTGTFFQTTQPVSGTVAATKSGAWMLDTAAKGTTTAGAPTSEATDLNTQSLHVRLTNASVAVTGTFWQATQPVSFTQQALPANQSVNVAQIAGVATSVNTGVRDAGTQRVTIATNDLVPVSLPTSTLAVTATAAVNTATTASLPAAGAGLFHYITSIQVMKLYNVLGVAAGAGVIITSTNLPGSPAWTTEQAAGAVGTVARVVDLRPAAPIKSSVANTITTIAAPAQLQTIWRINVTYYTGP